MTTMTNEQLLEKVTAALNTATANFDGKAEAALKEAKKSGDISAELKPTIDQALTQINALGLAQAGLKEQMESTTQEMLRTGKGGTVEAHKSIGQQVASNEGLQAFAQRVAANDRSQTRIHVPVVRNALTSGDVPAGIIEADRDPNVLPLLRRRLFVRDLLSVGRTKSNAIFWVQQTGYTNNAAVVAENTKKPESTITYAPKTTAVSTIAHLFKASKQILDDFEQLASDIDDELRYGLKYAEENEILFGDGTGVHLKGIIPQATAYNAAFNVTGKTAIDDIRLAMLQAQLARLPASGTVLHYTDWARIELTKDSTGRYIMANPLSLLGPVLWGIPVVPTEIAAMVGKFLTGGFKGGAQLYDREDVNVVIATENNDDFEKNMITIRCEERLALAVKRPEAFIYGTLTPAPTGT